MVVKATIVILVPVAVVTVVIDTVHRMPTRATHDVGGFRGMISGLSYKLAV